MKKLNKKLALAMLSLGFAALTPSVASADSCAPKSCDPCNTSSDCWSFDVGVDFLYWKPCVDDLDYSATVSGEVGNIDNALEVRYNSVCPDWEPGFRITLKKESAWKSFDLSFSYTWLDAGDSQSSHGGNGERIAAVGLHPFLVDENSPTGFYDLGKGKWELSYQTFDVLLSYPFRCGSCHTITPFFGVEVAKLDQEWKAAYEYQASTGPAEVAALKWESDYRGAGLKLGTDYNYLLCDGLSLFARASGTILIGDADTTNRQSAFEINADGTIVPETANYIEFKDDDCCHVVPGCHLQLGLQYEDETCGCEYKLRLGYEMVKWYNLQNPRRWFEATDGGNIAQSTHSNTTTLGFHGLLAGVEFKF
ncbi:Lpg1974 family pore-forming outer membrane protein [Estrella lausannensis]|uniref:Outer membrane protein n=1 Tax=Estrella lausannensis TaxID=483423 RepID=A0A0H5DR57_9BACT|nr:Lpg1974 family pore-forming outer membrane protein [Estrella lausannensis]CRX38638.1 Outer membrane protein [Estrella lausannensis]